MWVDRVALNNDVFFDTSTELIRDDEIHTAVATRAVDELFLSVDVQAELFAETRSRLATWWETQRAQVARPRSARELAGD